MAEEVKREAVVYLLRDTKTLLPFYIGSSIASWTRKCYHMHTKCVKHDKTVQTYVNANNIDYTFEIIYKIIGKRSEVLLKIRKIEQKYILKSRYELINKRNPLPCITKLKKRYPWLSNKTLNKSIKV